MPVSPELGAEVAKTVAEIYADATATLLGQVARRLERGITQPGWAEAKLVELHRLREDARAAVVRLDALGPDAARQAVDDATAQAARAAVADLNRAGITASLTRTSTATVEALARETAGTLSAAHPRILRAAEDVYRSTVAEATGQVSTGAMTRRQAAQRALDRFAMSGITGFVDTAGRGWELASYAEMAVRTAGGRAAVAGYTGQLVAHDVTLGFVLSGPGPCRMCDPWTGRVLTLAGRDRRYASLDQATAAGLLHPNCRCTVEGYIPGVSDTGRDDRPPADTRRQWDRDRQEQRRLERGVRQWKRREAVALDDDARRQARAKVREWQRRAREHDRSSPLTLRQLHREQVDRAR